MPSWRHSSKKTSSYRWHLLSAQHNLLYSVDTKWMLELECQIGPTGNTRDPKRVFQVAKCQVHLRHVLIPLRLKLGLRNEVI